MSPAPRLVGTLLPRTPADAARFLAAPPAGVDDVELRLDALAEPTPAVVRALLALPRGVPVIATCRAAAQGGLLTGAADAEDARLALLAAAGEAGADLLDVEDGSLARLPASVPGGRIASCHIARSVPRLGTLARRLLAHGATLAKLAAPADSPRRLAELLELQEECGPGLVVVPTGRLAEAGRVMLAARGAPLCYGALDAERRGHQDQPSVTKLHDEYAVAVLNPGTRFLAVVGRPLGHSLSPRFHNGVLRGAGRNLRMVPMEVDALPDLLEQVDALRLDGLAVTHPFKQDAVSLAAAVLPGARMAGAANTLLRTPAGWQARNTDWKAACDLLPRILAAWRHADGGPAEWLPAVVEAAWKGTAGPGGRGKGPGRGVPRVLLLGAGGAARAVAVALTDLEVELSVWSRRLSNARELALDLADSVPAVAVPDPSHAPSDLVINATPVGMPGCDAAELSALGQVPFRPGSLLLDLTYGGGASPMRAAAAAAGVPVLGGEVFFGLQARRQAEVFSDGAGSQELHLELARRCGLLVAGGT